MIYEILDYLEKIFSLFASSIVLYLFFFKKEKIKTLFEILINYGLKTTIYELTSKIDRLNDYSVADPEGKEKVINIFNEIYGQIKGNQKIQNNFNVYFKKLNKVLKNPNSLDEPLKRSMTSELREILRNLDISNYSSK